MQKLTPLLILATAAYWLLMFTLTHLPRVPGPVEEVNDKLAHFAGYFGLGLLLYLCVWVLRPQWRMPGLIVWGICLAYGAFDELTQPLVGRGCEFADWLADAAGSGLAILGMSLVRRMTSRPDQSPLPVDAAA